MVHICWSRYRDNLIQYDGDINHGVWAGDRFDIVTEETLQECVASGEIWKDVSKTFVATVTALWKAENEIYSDNEGEDDSEDSG